jgi:aminopeptidase N
MATTEITRDETRQRAELLTIESYEIWLDFARGAQTFGSQSVVRFGCTQPGAASYIDLVAEQVHEIVLNGVPIDPAVAFGGGRITLPDLAGRNELRVVADCRYSRDGTGMHRSVDSADGKVYAYTKFEPAYARRVFANFEQPDLKAPFIFHVTAPGTGPSSRTSPPSPHFRPPSGPRPVRTPPSGISRRRRRSRLISPPSWRASTRSSRARTRRPAARRCR